MAEVLKILPGNITKDVISKVIGIIKRGGLVLLPTETVYGLAGDAYSHDVFMKISLLKSRPSGKAFPVQVARAEECLYLAAKINLTAGLLMRRLWPGALTIVFEGAKDLPFFLKSDQGKVGIRVPDFEPLRLILLNFGRPLLVTSANISGEKSPTTIEEINEKIKEKADLILDSGKTILARESTVVDITAERPVILREGVLSRDRLREALALKKITFICTGNSCRSVMAKYYLEKLLKREKIEGLAVDSAGIGALPGFGASSLTLEVLREESLDAAHHQAKPLTGELVEESDWLIVMGEIHRQFIYENFPESKNRVRRLTDFFGEKMLSHEIADPIGQGRDVYLAIFFQIKKALECLVQEIRQLQAAFS